MYDPLLDGEYKIDAAIALCTAYSQGLETLFAFLGAAVQAPDCVVGYLLRYENRDLNSVIDKIRHNSRRAAGRPTDRFKPVLSRLPIEPVTWRAIADAILRVASNDKQYIEDIRSAFATSWERLADDFRSPTSNAEYQSLKHGLRARLGGFRLGVGLEREPGIPAAPEDMRVVGYSPFGTSFFLRDFVFDTNRTNFAVEQQSLNWDPRKYQAALALIAVSLENVIVFLKSCNGVDANSLQYNIPTNLDSLGEPWNYEAVGINSFRWKSAGVDWRSFQPVSEKTILDTYDDQSNTTP